MVRFASISFLFVSVGIFSLTTAGCGTPAPTVVEQPQKSPEALAAEAAAYDAEMDAN
jgi:hypothetical protein